MITATSFTPTVTLPNNGSPIWVRLWTRFGSVWQTPVDYVFSVGQRAAITDPVRGSVLPGSIVTFSWGGAQHASDYWLDVGTSQGIGDIKASGAITATSYHVTGIPITPGQTIFVRLWTRIGGVWHPPFDYLYSTFGPTTSGIAPTKTEVNLSAFPIDKYFAGGLNSENGQPNGPPLISGCPANITMQECIRLLFQFSVPGSYRDQRVIGVRFFFGLDGGHYSTPFGATDGETPTAEWVSNLRLFFRDLKSYGILRITPTPSFSAWSGSKRYTETVQNCVSPGNPGITMPLIYFPWLPYGHVIEPDAPDDPRPDRTCGLNGNDSYRFSAIAPSYPQGVAKRFWGWPKILGLFDKVIEAAKLEELDLNGFDYFQEVNFDFTTQARMIYDPPRNVNVLASLRTLMANHGFNPNLIAPSGNFPPKAPIPTANCTSIYGDSALVITLSGLADAIEGNPFGAHAINYVNNLPCGPNNQAGSLAEKRAQGMQELPPEAINPRPTFIDIHTSTTYPTLAQTADWSKTFYSSVWDFLVRRNRTADVVIFGETNPVEREACQSEWTAAHAQAMLIGVPSAGSPNGYKGSSLFLNSGGSVVMRPWHRTEAVFAACNPSPHVINPPYRPQNP